MFGLGKEKKGAPDDWTFDLEDDLKDVKKRNALKSKSDERIGQLKTMLRQGEDKKTFDDAQTLMHGYLALQKVMQRVKTQ